MVEVDGLTKKLAACYVAAKAKAGGKMLTRILSAIGW
jgi:hypothetical protein